MAKVVKITEGNRQTVKKVAKKASKKATKKATPKTTGTISLVTKKNPFSEGSKRYQKWSCLRDGQTVAAAMDAMKAKNLPGRSGFIRVCEKAGHIKIG